MRSTRENLDDAELDEKLRAAHSYTELRPEVERTLEHHGTEPFRTEYLWPVDLSDRYGWDPRRIPYYESYGAERVTTVPTNTSLPSAIT